MGYVTRESTIFPMTYPIGEAYVRPTFPTIEERDIEIVCTLRENHGDQTRGRVKSWVNEYAKSVGLNIKAGEVSMDRQISCNFFRSIMLPEQLLIPYILIKCIVQILLSQSIQLVGKEVRLYPSPIPPPCLLMHLCRLSFHGSFSKWCISLRRSHAHSTSISTPSWHACDLFR